MDTVQLQKGFTRSVIKLSRENPDMEEDEIVKKATSEYIDLVKRNFGPVVSNIFDAFLPKKNNKPVEGSQDEACSDGSQQTEEAQQDEACSDGSQQDEETQQAEEVEQDEETQQAEEVEQDEETQQAEEQFSLENIMQGENFSKLLSSFKDMFSKFSQNKNFDE